MNIYIKASFRGFPCCGIVNNSPRFN